MLVRVVVCKGARLGRLECGGGCGGGLAERARLWIVQRCGEIQVGPTSGLADARGHRMVGKRTGKWAGKKTRKEAEANGERVALRASASGKGEGV